MKTGPHVKDPVTTGYPGKSPADVQHLREGNAKVEVTPASIAPRDPATGKPILNPVTTDQIHTPTQNIAADEKEINQISTSAEDTLGGATSKDVNRGLGAPAQGESSAQLHHNGQPHRKREHEGTAQYGPQGGPLDLGQRHRKGHEVETTEYVSHGGPLS